ncbi:MAG: TolB family protein [Chloroflexota bacterium]
MIRFRALSVGLILALTALACAFQTPSPSQPTANVETVVAATFQALTPGAAPVTPPPASSDVLPRTLYYLANDNAGLLQVFRMEKDGKTVRQVTFETSEVRGFDPSPVDGSVAYVSNNQLLLINADGSNRRVLVDGGPQDVNNPFLNAVSSPVFSPNGKTLAYGFKGLNFYALDTGVSNLVIENLIENIDENFQFPRELYSPDRYSPDGSKLLVTLGYYEGASSAIYYPAGNALVRLSGGEGAAICCGEVEWTADGAALFSGSPTMGMFTSGLWRVDAASGAVITLLPGDPGNGTYNYADDPHLGPDGQLYFFFANMPVTDEFISRTPLQLVRSAPDGVTGRTVLRPDTFELMNENLWAPDASFVIVAYAPIQDVYQGGRAEIVYLDGRPNVALTAFAMNMKWGP